MDGIVLNVEYISFHGHLYPLIHILPSIHAEKPFSSLAYYTFFCFSSPANLTVIFHVNQKHLNWWFAQALKGMLPAAPQDALKISPTAFHFQAAPKGPFTYSFYPYHLCMDGHIL